MVGPGPAWLGMGCFMLASRYPWRNTCTGGTNNSSRITNMRLAILALLAATTVQAANLRLPTPSGPTTTAQIRFPDTGVRINIGLPASYPTDWGPNYGKSGDNDDAYTVIGAPEAWGDGTAFVYSTQTGEYLRRLRPMESLLGGVSRPQFGHSVLMHEGLAIVSAPNAGGDTAQSPGRVFVFNPATGEKLQTIIGPDTHWGFGQAVLDWGLGPHATGVSKTTGAVHTFPLAIISIPEPGGAWLAALGLLAARRR